MTTVKMASIKKIGKFFKSKKVIAIVLIVAVVASIFAFGFFGKKDEKTGEVRTATVSYGNVSKAIEGSGTIAAIDEYEVSALSIKGEVLECTFEVGDIVEKDDVLYKIDTSDMERSIENAQKSLEKAQISYNDTLKDYNEIMENQKVYAPVSGVLQTLSIENGDDVNNGFVIATIKNSDEMKLDISFNSDDAKNIYVGEKATVALSSSYTKVDGTVTRVGTGDITTNGGAIVRDIEITVTNPGAIKEGDKATALVGNYACNNEGVFKYSHEETINAKVGGEVYNLNYKQGDYIEKGALLLNIDADYKESTLKNAKMSLDDAYDNLERLYEDMEDYTIKAPIGGEIVEKNINKGEKIDTTNSNEPLAIIHDSSTLYFDMNIDELDIVNIKENQKVEFTADSYENEKFTGYVEKVKKTYTSQQGVTSYPVTVIVDSENKDLLLPGMNVSASIIIEERENVLVLPVSAVRRGNVVIAKTSSKGVGVPNKKATTVNNTEGFAPSKEMNFEGGKPSGENKENTKGRKQISSEKGTNPSNTLEGKDNPYLNGLEIPEGYKAIFVETGLSDDSYIEIVSGLNEGDIVVLPDITAPSSTNQFGLPTGGMGGPMGGSPMSGNMGQGRPGATGQNRQSSGQNRQSTR